MNRILLIVSFLFVSSLLHAQRALHGEVVDVNTGEPVAGATVSTSDSIRSVLCNEKGKFSIQLSESGFLRITAIGYESKLVAAGNKEHLVVLLVSAQKELDAVVVTGTMKPVKKLESPVAVEVYTPQFFKKNPTPSIFESLQNINGVRPQLNCSVCNTGDIHINGLEGPYTMITIDGMPIVSSLASVYGLFGIPTQLIDRVEIVKGPASGLYGSEAIGGLINIITKSPDKAPLFTANFMTTNWLEHNLDLGVKIKVGKRATSLLGVNYYNYQHPIDKNADQFTDVTLQHRISVFNKLSFARKNNRVATIAGRYFYENRWGGEMRYNKSFRGTDSVYGESIYTNRWELIGNYQLPVKEKIFFSFSATGHNQDSYYGTIPYLGKQRIIFNQFTWDKQAGASHSLLIGTAARYNFYDDNSTATSDTLTGANKPDKYILPGIFVQDEWKLHKKHLLLLGLRYDYHPVHKGIITPRVAWKWILPAKQVLRLNAGTGFRVVSLFTEEHAALTGARAVEIKESLNPEKSFNVNLNYSKYFKWNNTAFNIDASAWYSYFNNQIIPDYDTDPNKIIYKNLSGYAASKGVTLNAELNIGHRFKSLVGVTLQDVAKFEKDDAGKKIKQEPVLTERWSGTWALTYSFPAVGLTIDYTGNIYGPMRLPLLSALDPRPAYSPVWSIQNIQLTKLINPKIELFGGIKNLLNWTPAKNTPFIIARSHDPFDKQVQYGTDGKILPTADNPYALSFDPSYVYAPNQGIRFFAGIRFTLKK
ncbi:TonB-dependent receptor [Chitinophagaceae bacterium IBVUCB2]|nr:TonB-dependent receptor [Chitinophagaceae bacterium IBVUCB2]